MVAFEALAQGPEGPLATPDVLFSAARRTGMLREPDELCRASAFLGAAAVGPVAPLTHFVNVEPEVLSSAPIAELLALAQSVPGELRVVLEFTERALTSRPAELLRTADRVRELGWGVALDDVGAARPRWRSWRSCAHSVCSNPQPSRRRQTGVALLACLPARTSLRRSPKPLLRTPCWGVGRPRPQPALQRRAARQRPRR